MTPAPKKLITDENEVMCWHYDHNKGRSLQGFNLLNCLYQVDEISVIGMTLSALVGINNVAMPIFWGGLGLRLMGIALIFVMPETGFQPMPHKDRNPWGQMGHTFKEGVAAVRAHIC